jgi:hypothetical protein
MAFDVHAALDAAYWRISNSPDLWRRACENFVALESHADKKSQHLIKPDDWIAFDSLPEWHHP